jgi:hypothetical protein
MPKSIRGETLVAAIKVSPRDLGLSPTKKGYPWMTGQRVTLGVNRYLPHLPTLLILLLITHTSPLFPLLTPFSFGVRFGALFC